MSKENILGTLVIVLLKAQHLIDNHTFYKQDPYAKLSLSGVEKRTPVDPKGGQHPVWDHEVRVPISKDPTPKNRTLELSCWSEERNGDQLLGEGKVDLAKTLQTGEFDDWVPLSINGTQRGEIYLEMTFFAAGPAPLTRRPSKFHPNERLARPAQPKKPIPGGLPAFSPPESTTSHPPHKHSPSLPAQPQQTPPQPQRNPQHQTSSGGQHLVPPGHSYSPGHSPPRTTESPLPPLPLADTGLKPVPTILRPGPRAGKRPVSEIYPAPSDASIHAQYPDPRDQPQQRPTNNRPQSLIAGSALPPSTYQSPLDNPSSRARPTSTYESPYGAPPTSPPGQITPPRTVYNSPPRTQYTPLPYAPPGSGNGTPQPAYTPPYTSAYPSYPGSQTNEPAPYPSGPGPNGFSFPVPHMTDYGQSAPPPQAPPVGGYAPYPGARPNVPPATEADSDLPDPYLQKRYQTPLPLPSSPPPQPQYQPHHSQSGSFSSSHSNSYFSTPVPPAGFAVAEPSHQQAPQQQYGLQMPDPGVSAAQRAEDEAERRRKEQEELDEKLARELDMQLNMTEEPEAPRAAVGMPGGW